MSIYSVTKNNIYINYPDEENNGGSSGSGNDDNNGNPAKENALVTFSASVGDERLKGYDMELSLLLKSLNGGAVVSCPHCGHQFDYDAETEHTFAQQVLDYAADYQRWITQDIVREEMEKLTPEIRTQVISLIDSVKSEKKEFSQKGLQDLMNYVRCPHCWGKVYRSI